MNLGKVVFDAGHYEGANTFGNIYSEGNVMLALALKLKAKGFDITREDGKDIELLARVRKAVAMGATTLISLHTDWIPPDNKSTSKDESKSTEGVMPIYSLNRPEDKVIAEELGHGLADAMGITFKQLYTRHASQSTATKPLDYYGILRYGVELGLKHVIIIEHCSHLQMSIDTEKKLNAITEYYTKMFKGSENMNSIIGKSVATKEQMTAYLKKVNPNAPDVAGIFLEEGEAEGICGDKAFCQACKETNFWRFGGLAKIEWNNTCGLGVTGEKVIIGHDTNNKPIYGEPNGNKFPDWRTGIRAQIQHLKAYASKVPLNKPCVDVRYDLVTKGVAPNWENLNGKWAVPGNTYGNDIVAMWNEVIKIVVATPSTPSVDYKAIDDKYKLDYDGLLVKYNGIVTSNTKLTTDNKILTDKITQIKTIIQ